ncbi:hypothetical protein D3P06_11370 [Paracoccus aestuarii]|uniref:Uncharacterized protein n=1 Tax=Paracoccus aestuarii TaxID=453842 RepID=A0A418ZUJ3_9RHOB|nr:hypothetical protein [Paracoccus aestuarii]RJL02344.1 hypothetical protein D3P06_11370 [Paracoccus aestuarii]WCQ98535.1 hypothetical protein JHW48_11565 [Paracoccus aestuarii]
MILSVPASVTISATKRGSSARAARMNLRACRYEELDGTAFRIGDGMQLRVPFSGETVHRTVFSSIEP